jgi:hypothetical protein
MTRLTEAQILSILTAETPCQGCANYRACAYQQLACKAFSIYAAGQSQSRWETVEREPDEHTYARLYPSNETSRRCPDGRRISPGEASGAAADIKGVL